MNERLKLMLGVAGAVCALTPQLVAQTNARVYSVKPEFTRMAPLQPPKAPAPTISLEQAIRLSLTYDPSIHLAEASRLSEQGAYSVEYGVFDHVINGSIEGRYDRAELLPGPFRQQAGQRLLFRKLAEEFQKVADQLRSNLASHNGRNYLPCEDPATGGLLTEGTEIVITDPDTGEETIITCQTESDIAEQEAQDEFIQALLDATTGGAHDAIEAAQEQNIAVANQAIAQIAEILDNQALKMRERDRKIGQTPTIEEGHQFTLSLGYSVPFRSGVVVTPLFSLQRTETHNVGKGTTKPNFLGRSSRDVYRAALGLNVTMPLLRGAGWEAVTGPERAALLGVTASNAELHQTESASALRTALAYWNLVAAQQRLGLFEESMQRQVRLGGLARTLAEADEIARVDLLNIDSRVADARSFVASGRGALASARADLARQIGLSVQTIADAPLASDDFPEVVDPRTIANATPDALQRTAFDARFDLLAARKRLEASHVLITTAKSNLRQRLDVDFTIGYLGFEENQNFGKGLKGALLGNYTGPSIILALDYELPFGNNFARGQLQQAYALANDGDIRLTNLQRNIDARIVAALADLRNAALEVDNQQATVRLYRQTIDNEYEKYKAGESTLIDYILTEENLTNALSSLISARQTYASALARLRFESGTLVKYGTDGPMVDPADLRRLPF